MLVHPQPGRPILVPIAADEHLRLKAQDHYLTHHPLKGAPVGTKKKAAEAPTITAAMIDRQATAVQKQARARLRRTLSLGQPFYTLTRPIRAHADFQKKIVVSIHAATINNAGVPVLTDITGMVIDSLDPEQVKMSSPTHIFTDPEGIPFLVRCIRAVLPSDYLNLDLHID